jgi:hypothetical protein
MTIDELRQLMVEVLYTFDLKDASIIQQIAPQVSVVRISDDLDIYKTNAAKLLAAKISEDPFELANEFATLLSIEENFADAVAEIDGMVIFRVV